MLKLVVLLFINLHVRDFGYSPCCFTNLIYTTFLRILTLMIKLFLRFYYKGSYFFVNPSIVRC
jgi:hypothetical protein